MIGSKKRLMVLMLRDTDEILGTVEHALDTASAEERPGLERALALIRAASAAPEDELRVRWVRQRLESVGFEGSLESVEAVKALRTAEPALSLLQAVQMTREAADQKTTG